MNGFGGMITFVHKGTMSDISIFMRKLKIFTIAESLGVLELHESHFKFFKFI